ACRPGKLAPHTVTCGASMSAIGAKVAQPPPAWGMAATWTSAVVSAARGTNHSASVTASSVREPAGPGLSQEVVTPHPAKACGWLEDDAARSADRCGDRLSDRPSLGA